MSLHRATTHDEGKSVRMHRVSTPSTTCRCMPPIHSPWDAARHLGVTVIRHEYLHNARGYSNGCSVIWIDPRQTYVEQSCTLAHELFHVIHGHVGAQPDHVEEEVRRATARWLVPWHRVLEAIGGQLTIHDIADTLSVTPEVLEDRLTHATPRELARLNRTPQCAESAA